MSDSDDKGSFLVVGNINHDVTYVLASAYDMAGKTRAVGRRVTVGGSGANTARWLATNGADVWMGGRVGADPEGQQCLDTLSGDGVHVDFVDVDGEFPTASTVVLLSEFSKNIVSFQPTALIPDFSVAQVVAAGVTAAHFSAADSYVLGSLAKELVAAGVKVSVELAGARMDVVRQHADVVLCNADELAELFDVDVDSFSPADVVRLGNPEVTWVVTNKDVYVVAVDSEKRIEVPVNQVEVVERLGGGDAFDAGMLFGWRNGSDMVTALTLGLASATLALTRTGAGPS